MRWQMTDKIQDFSPWRFIRAVKAGSFEEYGLLDRWGEAGLAPDALLLEAAIQAGRWLVEASSGFAASALLAEVEYWRPGGGLKPGERIVTALGVDSRGTDQISFYARQELVPPGSPLPADLPGAQDRPDLRFTAKFVELESLGNPVDRNVLWQEIRA